ncbi:hypothetical protein ABGB07_34125 [Micromonosporaceae bacterium B7E4]
MSDYLRIKFGPLAQGADDLQRGGLQGLTTLQELVSGSVIPSWVSNANAVGEFTRVKTALENFGQAVGTRLVDMGRGAKDAHDIYFTGDRNAANIWSGG